MLEGLAAVGDHARVDGSDGAALARDLGGDALGDLARGPAIDEHVVFGLAEHVDEAGGDHQLRGVDAPPGGAAGERADGFHAVPHHAHVGAEPGRPGAVHDAASAEEQVAGRSGRGGEEEQQKGRHTAADYLTPASAETKREVEGQNLPEVPACGLLGFFKSSPQARCWFVPGERCL